MQSSYWSVSSAEKEIEALSVILRGLGEVQRVSKGVLPDLSGGMSDPASSSKAAAERNCQGSGATGWLNRYLEARDLGSPLKELQSASTLSASHSKQSGI